MKWILQVDEGRSEDVANTESLRKLILKFHERATAEPLFAVLSAPDGATLAIGLGRKISVLSYTAPGGWPSQHVIGDVKNGDLVNYKYFDHFTEMPLRYSIPMHEAIEVAVEFFESGKLSKTVAWEDD